MTFDVQKVLRIHLNAFAGCASTSSVCIPACVTCLAEKCFSGCTLLSEFTFATGSHCQSIEWAVFDGCPSLNTIEIPASVLMLALHSAADSGLRLVRFACADPFAVMVEQAKADLDGAFELEVLNCSLSIPGRISRPERDSLIGFLRDPSGRQGASPGSKSLPQRTSVAAVGKARAGWGTPKAAGGASGWSSPTALASVQRRAPVQGAMNTASHPVEELPSDLLTAVSRPRANHSAGSPEVNLGLSVPEPEVGQIVVATDDVEIEPGAVSVSPRLKTRLSIEPAAFTFDFVDGSRLTVSDPHCVDLCATRALAVSGSHSVENIA